MSFKPVVLKVLVALSVVVSFVPFKDAQKMALSMKYSTSIFIRIVELPLGVDTKDISAAYIMAYHSFVDE